MVKSLKISILCEDQAASGSPGGVFLGQHGLSVFIEAEKRILFDTGSTDVFLRNAALLGINLDETDWIVLSHGHWDHADGLVALRRRGIRKRLILHPSAFLDRRRPGGEYIGMVLDRQQLAEGFELSLSRQPREIGPGIYFLGEIPRRNDFEAQETAFYYLEQGQRREDYVIDDSALAIKSGRGLVIITGCSHAGICNIVEHARAVTAEKHVHLVLGGFHLGDNQTQLEGTIDYFGRNRVDLLYPMHCTGLPALSRFYHVFGIKKLAAGDTVEITEP